VHDCEADRLRLYSGEVILSRFPESLTAVDVVRMQERQIMSEIERDADEVRLAVGWVTMACK
jgi:hypothetical protein